MSLTVSDGIASQVASRQPRFAIYSNKAGADPSVCAGDSRQLPVMILGIADGIVTT